MSSPLRLVLWGHPVAHSRSQELFESLTQVGGPRVEYELLDVPPAGLAEAVEDLREGRWDGANVTVPHKLEVQGLLDRLAPSAAGAGGSNVIVRDSDGVLTGENTDGVGFFSALTRVPRQVLILGDGGAARGLVPVLASRGAQVRVVSRHPVARGPDLAALGAEVVSWDSGDLLESLESADLLVQATSVGMHPNDGAIPPLPLEGIRQGLEVVDLVYRPWETAFLRAVRARGAQAVNGWPMLVHQAAAALNLWTQSNAGQTLLQAAPLIESRKP